MIVLLTSSLAITRRSAWTSSESRVHGSSGRLSHSRAARTEVGSRVSVVDRSPTSDPPVTGGPWMPPAARTPACPLHAARPAMIARLPFRGGFGEGDGGGERAGGLDLE